MLRGLSLGTTLLARSLVTMRHKHSRDTIRRMSRVRARDWSDMTRPSRSICPLLTATHTSTGAGTSMGLSIDEMGAALGRGLAFEAGDVVGWLVELSLSLGFFQR